MRVRVQQFQSIGDTTVEVDGLTVLVGPSHRGKSAFIRALDGLLFNRAGDQFVREGASRAVVEVTGLPTVQGNTLAVRWTKGRGANDYEINGAAFTRVGQGAPAPLVEAGYRDVWIGDKDRKKGAYLRPQVAGQFEPLFLLTQPGSFVSDVLSFISRHTVLLLAQGRCSADLRSVKQVLGLRRADLEEESRRLAVLDPLPGLIDRIQQLVGVERAQEQAAARLDQIRTLLTLRRSVVSMAGLDVPPVTLVAPVQAEAARADRVRRLVDVRRRAAMLAGVECRPGLVVPPDLGDQAVRARVLADRRRRWFDVTARQMGETALVHVSRVFQWGDRIAALAALTQRRVVAVSRVSATLAALSAIRTEQEQVEAALAAMLAEMKVCPICRQPIPVR